MAATREGNNIQVESLAAWNFSRPRGVIPSMRFALAALLVMAGCDMSPPVDSSSMAASPACGGQDQPCCVPSGGGAYFCSQPLSCDGLAWGSVSSVSTTGICGTYGGHRQSCGPARSCFAPHVCMSYVSTSQECIDPDGGGITCGGSGQPCCKELNAGIDADGQLIDGPPIWCDIGLRCNANTQCE